VADVCRVRAALRRRPRERDSRDLSPGRRLVVLAALLNAALSCLFLRPAMSTGQALPSAFEDEATLADALTGGDGCRFVCIGGWTHAALFCSRTRPFCILALLVCGSGCLFLCVARAAPFVVITISRSIRFDRHRRAGPHVLVEGACAGGVQGRVAR
jgi:hypothetical protein